MKKQHYIVEYDWNTYIFAIKKIQREWKMFNNLDIEAGRLIPLTLFTVVYCILPTLSHKASLPLITPSGAALYWPKIF